MLGIQENYMALYVAIVKGVSPDKAFSLLGNKPKNETETTKKTFRRWGRTEISIMRLMRKRGDKWDDIGRRFGISGKHARSLVIFQDKKITEA